MNIKRLIVIGGDSRIDYLLKALCDEGYDAVRFDGSEPLKKAIDKSDAVILGLPCSRDDKSVDAPDLSEEVLIKDLCKMMGSGKLLLAGKMSQAVKAVADVFSVRWVDYFQRDEFEILNAIPTAEGAIQIAMEELPITIHGANIVVTGFGKVAKPLCLLLKNMGANVTVCARKSSARAEARSMSFAATDFSYFNECIEGADVVYNTVPAVIIRREHLLSAKNTLIIDLASKPGGVDMEAALDLGVKVIWALGLPGKVAPVSAGNIIKETVCNIFSELGE